MNGKIVLIVIVAAIVAVAAVAVVAMGSGSNDKPASDVVRYEGNGGVTDTGETHMDSKIHEVLGQIFHKDGYHIKNWNTKANGSGDTYEIKGNVDFGIKLYAQWSDANTLGCVNMYSNVFHLVVGEKGSSDVTLIDDGRAELASSNAVLVVSPVNAGDTVSVSADNTVTIVSGTKTYDVFLTINDDKLTLGNGGLLPEGHGAYLEISQGSKNVNAMVNVTVIQHRSTVLKKL